MAADFTVRGDTKLDASGFSGGLSKLGSLAKKGLAVVGASLAAAGVAVGALAKKSLDAYSDYEQMVGGVKTLFGTESASIEEYAATVGKSVDEVQGEYNALVSAQNKVFSDARNAYKDAGMSANEYMQTVTSFSARLLQGLSGDSQKAAEIAKIATVDMADNANKMGTEMGIVQETYQSLARGNYEMLDNLKLGYGGTQAEMARLINDSGVLGDTMVATANNVNSIGFDKILLAIHAVQEEMGITGTTAKEAATTIAGSVNQAQAAWTNWLTGMADPSQDFSTLTTALVDSIVNVGKNVVPRLTEILPALGTGVVNLFSGLVGYIPGAVQQLLPALVSGATSLLQGVATMLPGLITSIFSTLPDVFSTLFAAAPGLASAGMQIVQTLGNAITQYGPTLMQDGLDMIQQLGQGMAQGIPTFLAQAMPILLRFTSNLRSNFGQIVNAGIDLILNLAKGLIAALPTLISYVPQIVTNIAGLINDNAPKLLEAGLKLIVMLGQGLIQAIPTLISNIPQIIQAVVAVFTAFNWLNLGRNIISLLKDGITSMVGAVQSAGTSIFDAVKNVIANLPSTLQNIGSNAIKSLAGGIRALVYDAQMAGMSVFSAIRTVLAELPSTLLALGQNAVTSMANGLRNMLGNVVSAAQSILSGIVGVVQALPGQLWTLAKDAAQNLWNAFISNDWGGLGTNIIQGIINGIASAVGGLVDAAVNAAKSAFEAAKNFLGIHSPSRLFRDEIGKMIPAGMAVGVNANTAPAIASVEAMADRMVSAGQATAAQMQARMATSNCRTTGYTDAPVTHSTKNYTQNVYFEQPMQAPDEIARELRIQNTYGLAGAR